MTQSDLWFLPDLLGDWWPGLQSIAAAIAAGLILFRVLPKTPVSCDGFALFFVFVGCLVVGVAGLGNSGLRQWGDQVLIWSLLLYVVCLAWRLRHLPDNPPRWRKPAGMSREEFRQLARDIEGPAREAALRAVRESRQRGGSIKARWR